MRAKLSRSFSVVLERASDDGDGRTVSGRVVPYGESATVDDGTGPYSESFAPGSFKRATRAPNRVLLGFEHHDGIGGIIGHGVAFHERTDGLYGDFRVLVGPAADTALQLIEAEVVTGFSVGFVPLSTRRGPGGALVRTACHLDEVSLCRKPAFAGSLGVDVRSADPTTDVAYLDEYRPHRSAELEDRLRALGLER